MSKPKVGAPLLVASFIPTLRAVVRSSGVRSAAPDKGASSAHLLVNVSQFGKLLAGGFDVPATEAKIDKITVKVVTLK